jgi:hypothetical protein
VAKLKLPMPAYRRPRKVRLPPKTSLDTGPFCGAQRTNRPGVTCKNLAGFRTDHPGVGRCFKHCGSTRSHKETVRRLTASGRYGNLEFTRVRDILGKLEAMEDNAMDLLPEIHLLRSLLIDFINNYDKNQEALHAWLSAPDNRARPRKLMDIHDAGQLVESISRVVHRVHQIQSEGAISLVTFRRVTESMGMIVARHIRDAAILAKISEEWNTLALDSKPVARRSTEDDDED